MDPWGYLQELVVVLLLIGANGLLAMLEMALVSSRSSSLEQQAEAGSKRAAYIAELAKEPTEFLSTVQIGITLVGIGTGVYSGAAFAAPLAALLAYVPFVGTSAKALAYGIVVALVTYLSIILGELIPKRIAINNPEKVIVGCADLVKVLVTVFKPFTLLLSLSTNFFLQLLQIKNNKEQPISEEEVRLLIEQGTASGVFNKSEQSIMFNALELDELKVSEIMTPRTQICWLDVNEGTEVLLAQITEHPYSCFVVADEDLDEVLGVLYTKRFLLGRLQQEYDLRSHIRQPLYVPESMRIDSLLKMFQKERIKVALVVDEFGALAGMVTLRDVIEHLVGDVPSYDEVEEQQIIKRDDHSWLVDGMLPLAEFADHFPVEEAEEQNARKNFNTIAGLVVALLGHIPTAGEKTVFGGWQLEVMDMDGNRVDKLLVTKLQEQQENA